MKKSEARKKQEWRGWAGLGALVVVLVTLVVWSLPRDGERRAEADAGATISTDTAIDAAPRATGSIERLPEATCETALLTDKSEEELHAVDAEAIVKLLTPRHCGPACADVKKLVRDSDHFTLEVSKADDYILPPKESFEAIAPGLTTAEREGIEKRIEVLVVRTTLAPSIDQMGARACFAATAALAESLSALVYDETVRRIETPDEFAAHVITAPLGKSVFVPRQIGVQLYRQDDGTARALTLGMIRFGSPDFIVRGAAMDAGPMAANVVDVVAASVAAEKSTLPFVVSLDDVARISGKKPADLSRDPSASKPLRLEVIEAERAEGDPDNDILELVPPGGATPEGWSAALSGLLGEPPQIVLAADDAELAAIAARARKDLPTAIKRHEAGEGPLFVKGPFPIPEHDDAGARTEWMWIEATSCDGKGCSGVLSNTPGYATNLAAGSRANVARDKTADWLLQLKDGGVAGGESIRALEKRANAKTK